MITPSKVGSNNMQLHRLSLSFLSMFLLSLITSHLHEYRIAVSKRETLTNSLPTIILTQQKIRQKEYRSQYSQKKWLFKQRQKLVLQFRAQSTEASLSRLRVRRLKQYFRVFGPGTEPVGLF